MPICCLVEMLHVLCEMHTLNTGARLRCTMFAQLCSKHLSWELAAVRRCRIISLHPWICNRMTGSKNEANYFTILIVYRIYTPGCLEWVRTCSCSVYLGRGEKRCTENPWWTECLLNLHSRGRRHGLTGSQELVSAAITDSQPQLLVPHHSRSSWWAH